MEGKLSEEKKLAQEQPQKKPNTNKNTETFENR